MIRSLVGKPPDGPAQAKKMACDLCKNPAVHLDAKAVVAIFMQHTLLREATGFLLSYLEGDRKEDSYLQTQLLEMNLIGGAGQVADAILDRDMFHHFDKNHIAQVSCTCPTICHSSHFFVLLWADVRACAPFQTRTGAVHERGGHEASGRQLQPQPTGQRFTVKPEPLHTRKCHGICFDC